MSMTIKKISKNYLNKAEFVSLMARLHGVTKTEAEKATNMVTATTWEALREGKGISLTGFGHFDNQERKARDGRNPKTGEKMRIKAHNQVVFKAGQKTKDAANNVPEQKSKKNKVVKKKN